MKKQILSVLLALALGAGITAEAVPAKRGLRDFRQADGTAIKAELAGDEYFHYYLSEDGLPLLADEAGTLRYVRLDASGKPELSPMAATSKALRSAEATRFTAAVDGNAVVEALRKNAETESVAFRAFSQRARAAAAKAAEAKIPQSGLGRLSDDFPMTGDVKALVILVEYSNLSFTHPDPHAYFSNMLNQEGFSEYGGTGSAKDYFELQSKGQFRPQFDVFGPVKLKNTRSYYGGNDAYGNDKNPYDMLVEAAKALDGEINFADYDMNNDGYVDNVFIFYAGQGEASYGPTESVWPHSYNLSYVGKSFKLDGKIIDKYGCTNEWEQSRPDGVGTFIHEFSHVMGLPDLYHTTNSYATYTPGSWSVMDYGPYNNDGCTPPNYSAYERNAMGWVDPEVISGPSAISIPEICESNKCYLIPTEKNSEFFLLENRQQTGWDKYIPGHGMLIWHIDYVRSVFESNRVNNTQSHQYVDIVEANNRANSQNESTMASYSWPGTSKKTSFTSSTSPALKSWSGKEIDLPLTEIAETNGIITFKVAGGPISLDVPAGVKAEPADDGSATLSWNAVANADKYVLNLYSLAAGAVNEQILTDEIVNETTYTVRDLTPGETYGFTVAARAYNTTGEASAQVEFEMPELGWQYVKPVTLDASEITSDGFTANWEAVDGAEAYLLSVEAEYPGQDLSETADFSGSTTTKLILPAGWSHTATSQLVYSSAGHYGKSAPSMKFSQNAHQLLTRVYPAPVQSISFWDRGTTGASAQNELRLEGRTDENSETWTELFMHHPKNDGTNETITVDNIPSDLRQFRFYFAKIGTGNLALDDVEVVCNSTRKQTVEGYESKNVGNVLSHRVTTAEAAPAYYYTVTALNSEGEPSLPSDSRKLSATTGIDFVAAPANTGLSVCGGDVIYSGSAGDIVTLYDARGIAVARVEADASGSAVVRIPAGGFYIASGPQGALKVLF